MIYLRLLLFPLLLLTRIAKSATPTDSICRSCPPLSQSSGLEARASGNIQVLQDLYRALYADWKRMVDEAEQLEQRHAEGLPDATFARIAILGARSVPPFAPGSDILRAIFKIHFDEYNRLMAEARRAGFYKLHLLSGADQDRVYAIMAQARQAQERMYQVMEEMDRVPPP
ncbi:hypothetical protein CF335_g794 [Tilletia laevis]|nr:hypothetical protein CF335_g794 [Tilletia laevis]